MRSTVDFVAAVDVGGTRIKAALVDRGLEVLTRVTEPTPLDTVADIGAVIQATVRRLVAQLGASESAGRLVGCGVVVPGLVDDLTGVGLLSVNLGWRDLPIRDVVEAALEVPTVLGHDVRAGLVAEARLGAAQGASNVLFVPVGTGIAGALMLDGSVVSAGGWAGELGHVTVDPDGPACACGSRGCLEVLASAAAIARQYAAATGRVTDAESVARLAADGDPAAVTVWDGAVRALATAIVAAVTITGVELVLVGGGLAQSGATLLEPLRAQIESRLTFQRPPTVARAALGDRAGSLGAACLAWDAQ